MKKFGSRQPCTHVAASSEVLKLCFRLFTFSGDALLSALCGYLGQCNFIYFC